MRFDPSGAARTSNLHGVELRVNRNAAHPSAPSSMPLPGTTSTVRTAGASTDLGISGEHVDSRTMGLASGGSAAVSVDLARCTEEMAEVQQRRNALEQQLAAYAAIGAETSEVQGECQEQPSCQGRLDR